MTQNRRFPTQRPLPARNFSVLGAMLMLSLPFMFVGGVVNSYAYYRRDIAPSIRRHGLFGALPQVRPGYDTELSIPALKGATRTP